MTTYNNIYYSEKYEDDNNEYRHVIVTKELSKKFPRDHLMTEEEWRKFGIQQSKGWIHYMFHKPEPHVLMFKRPIDK